MPGVPNVHLMNTIVGKERPATSLHELREHFPPSTMPLTCFTTLWRHTKPTYGVQGERVALDISKLQSYRLFPGQVVAVHGVNPTGKRVVASRIITQLAPEASASAALKGQRQAGTGPLPQSAVRLLLIWYAIEYS